MENDKNIEVKKNYGVVANKIDTVNVNASIPKVRHTILSSFLEKLIENKVFETNSEIHSISYEINEKINYNNVIKYKDIIKKYSAYYSICDNALNQIDNTLVGSKSKIFSSINDRYLIIKGDHLKKRSQDNIPIMNVVKESSDLIMDEMVNFYMEFIMNIENMDNYNYEDIEINIIALIIYCFIECKILEKPIVIKEV